MSGFLKGIFSGKEDEELEAAGLTGSDEVREPDREDLQQFTADVHGTIETEVDGDFRREVEEPENLHHDEENSLLVKGSPSPLELKEFSTDLVWKQGGVDKDEQDNVEKAQQLLQSLPEETPDVVKRQIVEAALKAFEVSISDIVGAASSEIDALREYIDEVNDKAREFSADSENRIYELEAEIERVRQTIRNAEEEQQRLVGEATEVIEEVEPVLEFFNPNGVHSGSISSVSAPVVASAPTSTVITDDDDDDDESELESDEELN